VEGRHQRRPAIFLPGAAHPRDGYVAAEQQAGRWLAEGDDDARPDRVDLPVEERPAARHLVPQRRSVLRRPTLHDVADVDAAAGDAEPLLDHLGQQLARASDERDALKVLLLARPLADEEQIRGRVAVAEDDLRPALREPAARALAERGAHLGERRLLGPPARLRNERDLLSCSAS
jgi:hypothetical protein